MFSSGNYGMYADTAIFAGSIEDPAKSEAAGKTRYALLPHGPKGVMSDISSWALSICAQSDNKDASWLFIQWATSPDVLLRATRDFSNLNPVRASTNEDPAVVAKLGAWGQGTYLPTVSENMAKYAARRTTITPQYYPIFERWMLGISEAWVGEKSVQQALDDAAADVEETLRNLGFRPGEKVAPKN
jgi:ABC-type glycerol-3-phosphate transport system substrate-binding protein